jgi:NADH:ubiquinone reductase (non-electrogenic)
MQVAEQQGKYLAAVLNKHAAEGDLSSASIARHKPFKYRHLGSMANIGHHSAVMELGESAPKRSSFSMFEGLGAWFAWRSAYLTRLGSFRKRIETAGNWTLTLLFGRDTSRW